MKPTITTVTAPVFTGQTFEERLKKLLSYNGPFFQFEKKILEFKVSFTNTPDVGKFVETSPINELKKSFYKYIPQRITSLIDNVEIGILSDQMDEVSGYVQATIEMRALSKKVFELDKTKPWLNLPSSKDEVEEIQSLLSEIAKLLDNLKQSIGGVWGEY